MHPPYALFYSSVDEVPESWRHRVRVVYVVPLTPAEGARVLVDAPVTPELSHSDVDFLRLVAQGLSAEAIARRTNVVVRSVYRRLAQMRATFGVRSTAELVGELRRRGI